MANKWKISALWGMQEVTFSTDPDSDGSDYKFLKVAGDITFQPNADVLERPGQTNDLVRQEHVVGAKGGTLSFPLEMKASGTPAVDATPAIAAEASQILEAVLGSVTRGTGTTVGAASGNGAVGTPMVVASAAGLAKYMMISVSGEVRFIKTISGTDIVLNRALSSNPANGTVVTASSMFKRSNTAQKSMAFVGKRDGIEFTFLGCKCRVAVKGIDARGTALLQVDVEVNSWSVTTKASLPSTVLSGITAVKGPVIKGGTFTIDGTEEVCSGTEFDPGLTMVFIDSVAATEGRAGVSATESTPQGVMRPYYAASRLTTFVNGTVIEVCAAFGSTSNGFGFMVPRAQIALPAFEDREGLVGENIPFMAVNNGTDPDYVICQF